MAIESNINTYEFTKIERFWQSFWEKNNTYKTQDFVKEKPTYYSLVMFPYPSGEGLHIGHPESYTASDILYRYYRAKGYNVLQPMGWDAFGLPAEQHAIATGTHPKIKTQENIATFKKQLNALGFAFDWSREINTTDPEYFKWTQWILLQLFKKGLAYVDERPVWWCEALGTVLANEEVVDGKSERGDYPVERRNLRQWILRITSYADRLLEGLETLNWPESTKRMQQAWIGRSEGVNLHYDIEGLNGQQLTTFTTRIDTIYGVTFIVIAPEHPLLEKLVKPEHQKEVKSYIAEAAKKSELSRTELIKDKTGVFTGSYALHPISKKKLPIWVADYVLMSYGTGVVQGVPANDERDYVFAQKYKLPIIPVIAHRPDEKNPPVPCFDIGYLVNSGEYNGLHTNEAKKKITQVLQQNKHGEPAVNYKLRDWLFSRQRYWGEPFPIIWVDKESYDKIVGTKNSELHEFLPRDPVSYFKEGKELFAVPLPTSQLPLKLPDIKRFAPTGSAEGPLANEHDWVNVYLNINSGQTRSLSEKISEVDWVKGMRETNTMPQWAGSCWYYLRYCDPHNQKTLIDPKFEKYWGVPNIYIGGAEHAVLHLLYARFWHQVLFDLGVVTHPEPFTRVIHQGLILGEPEYFAFKNSKNEYVSTEFVTKDIRDARTDEVLQQVKIPEEEVVKSGDAFILKNNLKIRVESRAYKMSKSRGNVISPDKIIAEYGTDALRMYEMFLGPLEASKPWNTKGMEGIGRFLRKVWREYIDEDGKVNAKLVSQENEDPETERILQETIKKVSEDIEELRFNTAIAQMMIFMNHFQKANTVTMNTAQAFIKLLAPFAPHICEELWSRIGQRPSICDAAWPAFDASKLVRDQLNVIIQVNGKLRGELLVGKDDPQNDVLAKAKGLDRVKAHLDGKQIVKEIYVPGKIVNFVVK